MADSIPGQFKDAIEAAIPEYAGRVWRLEHLPDNAPLPYVTVFDGVADAPRTRGDGKGLGWVRLVQVDHWQDVVMASTYDTKRIEYCLDGLTMHPGDGMHMMTAQLESTVKIPDEQEHIDHTAITLRVIYVPV